jgi:hypothetical protein
MFWMASASVKSATEIERSAVIGVMNTPRLWRMPMLKLSITDAPINMDVVCAREGSALTA